MINYLLGASRTQKRAVALLYDSLAIPVAVFTAMTLRYGYVPLPIKEESVYVTLVTILVTLIAFIRLGLYRAVVRFMTGQAFSALSIGVLISALTLATSSYLFQTGFPRSSVIIYLFTAFTLLGTPRLFIRSLVTQQIKNQADPVIIYGAGSQGIALANSLHNNEQYRLVAYIDDQKKKQNTVIKGIKVWSQNHIDRIVDEFGVQKVLIAAGKTSMHVRKQLIEQLAEKKLEIFITPPFDDILSGRAKLEELREVDINDLLGRDPVPPNSELLKRDIQGKSVMITGAGGSIGSELCRQVFQQQPESLILFDVNEYNLYKIEKDLEKLKKHTNSSTNIYPVLGSIEKRQRVQMLCKNFNVHTIYHAAAYKHVPLVESNIIEGISNNVLGTWYCAEAAIAAGVQQFVLVSTDKAVRSTSIMGASKRMAELVLQALSERQDNTLFSMVRFGNVLDSSGSVVPLFRQQIKEGGPITVTHPEIIRYFMTIPEAAQLVIQAGAMAKGGDVFVLDMGEPVKIVTLAKKMIHLSGLSEKSEQNPGGDIEIKFTGLRPGEKLYEELLIGDEVEGSIHPRIMTAKETSLNWPETHNILHHLEKACDKYNINEVMQLIHNTPSYYQQVEPPEITGTESSLKQ